jgi:hypothetical protein
MKCWWWRARRERGGGRKTRTKTSTSLQVVIIHSPRLPSFAISFFLFSTFFADSSVFSPFSNPSVCPFSIRRKGPKRSRLRTPSPSGTAAYRRPPPPSGQTIPHRLLLPPLLPCQVCSPPRAAADISSSHTIPVEFVTEVVEDPSARSRIGGDTSTTRARDIQNLKMRGLDWVADDLVAACTHCAATFSVVVRRVS